MGSRHGPLRGTAARRELMMIVDRRAHQHGTRITATRARSQWTGCCIHLAGNDRMLALPSPERIEARLGEERLSVVWRVASAHSELRDVRWRGAQPALAS